MGLLVAGLYARPTLRLSSDVSSLEPSVAWNRISKSWSVVLTVAETEPDCRMEDLPVFVISTSLVSGFPAGYKSKCGPGFRAPSQCVVSTEMTPSNGAAISYTINPLLEIVREGYLLLSRYSNSKNLICVVSS